LLGTDEKCLEVKVWMFRHQFPTKNPISTIGFRAYYVNKHFFLASFQKAIIFFSKNPLDLSYPNRWAKWMWSWLISLKNKPMLSFERWHFNSKVHFCKQKSELGTTINSSFEVSCAAWARTAWSWLERLLTFFLDNCMPRRDCFETDSSD
jgi:hypothetical protein